MHILVLGSGAGGGLPQWNCNCSNCQAARTGSSSVIPRTQSSIAVSGDGENWVLCNASPDIRTQLQHQPLLHPKQGLRDSQIKGIILTDAQIDHTTGLLIMREGERLRIHCTESVHRDLSEGFPIFKLLTHYCGVDYQEINLQQPSFEVPEVSNLKFTAVPLISKAPPYSPHRHDPSEGDTIGLIVEDVQNQSRLFYAPGISDLRVAEQYISKADCILVDGTFWTADELVAQGISKQYAQDMGHNPLSGDAGMLSVLEQYPATRKILIHINNTNPILDQASSAYAALAAAGVEVATDGMKLTI